MKFFIILFLLILVSFGFGQYVYVADITVNQLFDGTAYEDSVIAHPDSDFYALYLKDIHSGITSKEIEKYRTGGEVDIFARHIGPADSVLNIYIDVWRQPGYPDRNGWERNHLFLFDAADETAYAILKDSTWFGDKMTNKYRIIVTKSDKGAMYNMIGIKEFKRSK